MHCVRGGSLHFTESIFWLAIINYGYGSYPCVSSVLVSAELSGNDLQNLQDVLQYQRGWLATSQALSQLEHLLTKQCLSRLLKRKILKQLLWEPMLSGEQLTTRQKTSDLKWE